MISIENSPSTAQHDKLTLLTIKLAAWHLASSCNCNQQENGEKRKPDISDTYIVVVTQYVHTYTGFIVANHVWQNQCISRVAWIFRQFDFKKCTIVLRFLRGHRKSSQKASEMNKISFTWNPLPPPKMNKKIALQASTPRPMCIQNTIWSMKCDFFENPHPPKRILFVSGLCELVQWSLSDQGSSREYHLSSK